MKTQSYKRALLNRIFLCLFLFSQTNCKTVEALFNPIYITAGFENSSILFYSRESSARTLANDIIPNSKVFKSNDEYRTHNFSSTERGFFTIGSLPQRPWKDIPYMRYFAYKFSIESPRLFRGSLLHYPDAGFRSNDATLDYLLQIRGPDPLYSRRIDYMYYDTRAFGTLYAGYFDNPNFFWGAGFGFGVSQYSLQLVENQREISDIRNARRNIYNISLIYGYQIGRFFDQTILDNTYFFAEITNEFLFQNPIRATVLTANGATPDSLYLSLQYFRIGIIKEINLIQK